jgi:hypothetical protein
VRTPAKILPLAIAVAVALSFGVSAGAQPSFPSLEVTFVFQGTPSLSVDTISGSAGGVSSLSAGGGGQASLPPPARVVVDAPSGYTPNLAAAPGTPAGLVFLASSAQSGSTVSSTTIFGVITVADPAQYQNNAAAQACATGPYLAVWNIDATVLGLFKTSMPIFLVNPTTSPSGGVLVFCAPTLTNLDGTAVAAPPISLDLVSLLLSNLTPPTSAGSYLWHAYVVPQTPGTGAPNDRATYELRALVPVPHAISVKGSYNAKLRDAVLTGRVTEQGKPQPHADVFALTLSSVEPIHAKTDAAGRFTIRARVAQTSTFFVQVPDQTGPCQGASTAPAGCASTTVSATSTKKIRVVVPRH